GSYHLESEPFEPDSYINSLNQDLIMIQETVAVALPLRKVRFLYDGLSYLIMHVLTVNLKYVKRINKYGVQKLLRNVESLQQSLTNIAAVHEKGLDHVRTYFELLNSSGADMLHYMETHKGEFTFDEYKVVLDLIFQDVLEDSNLPKKEYTESSAATEAGKGLSQDFTMGNLYETCEERTEDIRYLLDSKFEQEKINALKRLIA
ncbi:hypothetical protein HDU99_007238, partial [Rhizoclosmatium hyalinum]